MVIDERELLNAEAFLMTQRLERRLRDAHVTRQPRYDLASAVGLIHNYVHRFNQPALAVDFALHFHNTVEIWGEWGAWAEALDTLLEWDGLEPIQRARLINFRSRAALGVGDHAAATRYCEIVLELGMAYNHMPLVANALNRLGRTAYEQDDYVASRAYLEQADELDLTTLSPREAGHIYINLGNVAVQQEQFTEAHNYYKKAIICYQEEKDDLRSSKVLANIADLYHREHQHSKAITILQNAIRIFQTNGARYDYAVAQNSLGCIFLTIKRWNEALKSFMCALEEIDKLGALATKAWILTNVVELYVKTHQYDKAEAAVAEGYELAALCNKPLVTAGVHVDYGTMLFEQGEYDEARRLWSEALAIQDARGAEALAKNTRSLLSKLPTNF